MDTKTESSSEVSHRPVQDIENTDQEHSASRLWFAFVEHRTGGVGSLTEAGIEGGCRSLTSPLQGHTLIDPRGE